VNKHISPSEQVFEPLEVFPKFLSTQSQSELKFLNL